MTQTKAVKKRVAAGRLPSQTREFLRITDELESVSDEMPVIVKACRRTRDVIDRARNCYLNIAETQVGGK